MGMGKARVKGVGEEEERANKEKRSRESGR
jgi:hypothetical protein